MVHFNVSTLRILLPLWLLLLLSGCPALPSNGLVLLHDHWEYQVLRGPDFEAGKGAEWKKIELPARFSHPEGLQEPLKVMLRRPLPPELIQLAKAQRPVSLFTGLTSDVARFYLDETLLGSRGEIQPYQSGLYRHAIYDIPLELLRREPPPELRVELYTEGIYPLHLEGPQIYAGPTSRVYRRYYSGEIILFALLAMYWVVGAYHLVLGVRRTAERYYFYFGLFSVCFGHYVFFRTFTRDIFFGAEVLLRIKLEYILLCLLGMAYLLFLEHLFEIRWKRLRNVLLSVSVAMIVSMAFGSYHVTRVTLQVWQLFAILLLFFSCALSIQAYHRGKTWAFSILLGFGFMLGAAVIDSTATWGFRSLGRGTISYASIFFMLGIANTLAERFIKIHAQANELNANLERMVLARTEELRHARDAAEESSRAKTAFLAHLSHEIRTPMHGILGTTEVLLDTELQAEQRNLLEVIRTTGQRFLSLLNDALDLSKIEAGRMELALEPFELRTWLREVLQPFQVLGQRNRVQLKVFLDHTLPAILVGDSVKLRQILSNLLSNAFKFTQQGSVTVRVERAPLPHAGVLELALRFTVRDTGIGVPKPFQDRIFESFAQADVTMSRRYGGTGLGTTICARLVQMMKGQIGLRSPVREADAHGGPGSEFWCMVVLRRVPDEILPELSQTGEHPLPTMTEPQRPYLSPIPGSVARTSIPPFERHPTPGEAEAVSSSSAHSLLEPYSPALPDERHTSEQTSTVAEPSLGAPTEWASKAPELVPTFLWGAPPAEPTISATDADTHALGSDASLVAAAPSSAAPPSALPSSAPPSSAPPDFASLGQAAQVPKLEPGFQRIGPPHVLSFREELLHAPPSSARAGGGRTQPVQVLVAEDNQVNQLIMQRFLKALQCEYVVVPNGKLALEALERGKFDLVLLDLQMPVMDGLETIQHIRTRGWTQLPVIALTANAGSEDQTQCRSLGMDGLLAKPCTREELRSFIYFWTGYLAPAQRAGGG
ncbi:MAG: response regulator [Myxococcota bacterium]